jgi:oligoribonuclease (3'-5' exoribonuclease)
MAGYRDLPIGKHDARGMLSPKIAEAFAKFASLEQELLTFLQRAVERDQRMLAGMRRAAGSGR